MSQRTVSIEVTVTIADDVEPEELAEKLFNFLASDPENVFAEIETVDAYDWTVL